MGINCMKLLLVHWNQIHSFLHGSNIILCSIYRHTFGFERMSVRNYNPHDVPFLTGSNLAHNTFLWGEMNSIVIIYCKIMTTRIVLTLLIYVS